MSTKRPRATLRSIAEMECQGLVAAPQRAELKEVAARYAVAITPAMADLIDRDDPDDPIARQFVPSSAELRQAPAERGDPIGDGVHEKVPGLVHRYPDRVLLKLVQSCAIYCRFCFRRETVGPGAASQLSGAALERALTYIEETPAVWEVVVTGGDPMVVSARRLEALMERLAGMGHVRVVRFHTRIPAVDPARITPQLVEALRHPDLATWVVLHANHPRELNEATRRAIDLLVDGGIPLLSQSVLLKGVNDEVETLGALMRAFVESRVKPYYLHHPDLAPGTGHFRIELQQGQHLMRQLRGRWSGLCQPSYMLDLPGGHGKSPVGPSYVEGEEGHLSVRDYQGRAHPYPPLAGDS